MKKSRFTAVLLLLLLLIGNTKNVFSSDSLKIEPSISADIVSRYVWRGMLLSKSPAVQPTLDFTLGGLSLGSWASYTFSQEEFQEVDLYLSYNYNFLTLTLNDYYNPNELPDSLNNYLDWDKSTSMHSLEIQATIADIGDLPLSLMAGVFVYGKADAKNDKGEIYHSTYLELGYYKTIGNTDFSAFIGATPFEGYYASKAALVNIGVSATHNLEISDRFSLPIAGSFVVNPDAKSVFFVFGISL